LLIVADALSLRWRSFKLSFRIWVPISVARLAPKNGRKCLSIRFSVSYVLLRLRPMLFVARRVVQGFYVADTVRPTGMAVAHHLWHVIGN
jgi:hypothetical protein